MDMGDRRMSFSSEVKKELYENSNSDRHCNIAELTAIVILNGTIVQNAHGVAMKIQTENSLVAKKCFDLLFKLTGVRCEVLLRKNHQLKEKKTYALLLNHPQKTTNLLSAMGFVKVQDGFQKYVSPLVVRSTCCKRAYIRGAFLSAGSISNPEKNYHLEIVNTCYAYGVALQSIVKHFEMDAKIIERKGYFVLYIKEGEQIVDLLNIIGAHESLMELENVRILKDVRNNINRAVNCETANLGKTVSASVKQVEDIQYIVDTVGFAYLSKQLQQVAEIRLSCNDSSLKELGEMLTPPITKSGVNHRLKKISEIAKTLKGEGQYEGAKRYT